MKDTANVFLKRLINFSIGPVAGAFISFITLPVTTWLIMPEEFGKAAMFMLAYSMVSMFLYLGIDVAFIREFNAKEDKIKLFWNSLTVPLTLSVLFSFIILINGRLISQLLFSSYQEVVMKALAVSLPFAVISRFNLIVVRMQERGKLYSFLSILRQLSKFVFTIVLVLSFEKTFVYIVIAQVASIFLQTIVTAYFIRDYWLSPRKLDWNLFKMLLLFGLPFIPTALIEWVLNGFDKVALRKWADFNEIGLYSAGFKIVSLMAIVKTSFATFWGPTAYRWHESGEGKEKFQIVNNLITSTMFIFGAFIVLFRKLIFGILASDYRSAAVIVPFLLFIPILTTIKSTTVSGITISRKTYTLIPIYIISTIVNVLGNWWLVPKYGALGASIATGFSSIITFWISSLVSRRLWRIKLSFNNMIINNIVFLIFAFVSLLHNVFLDLLFTIIIVGINYKSFVYLNKKFPIRKIKKMINRKMSIGVI